MCFLLLIWMCVIFREKTTEEYTLWLCHCSSMVGIDRKTTYIRCVRFLVFSTDTPLLVRSSSDSALSPQPTDSEPPLSEDTTGMVRPQGPQTKDTHTHAVWHLVSFRQIVFLVWYILLFIMWNIYCSVNHLLQFKKSCLSVLLHTHLVIWGAYQPTHWLVSYFLLVS